MSFRLYTSENIGVDIEVGELIVAVAVHAASVVRDVQQNIRNLMGGTMGHYEKLVESTVERALERLGEKATERGYDGVVCVRVSHPSVAEGGVEVVVVGNGFRFKNDLRAPK